MIELRILRKRYARPFDSEIKGVSLSLNLQQAHDDASYVTNVLQWREATVYGNLGTIRYEWKDVPVVGAD